MPYLYTLLLGTFICITLSGNAFAQTLSAKGIQPSTNAAELTLATDIERLENQLEALTEHTLPDLEAELYKIHEKLNANATSIQTLQQALLTPQEQLGMNMQGLLNQVGELMIRVQRLEAELAAERSK